MPRRRVREWLALLALAAALTALAVSPGDPGDIDTVRRLQVAHAWWTGQDEVPPSDAPFFGIRGSGGRLRAWYGIGQSLLLLPADLAATAAASLLAPALPPGPEARTRARLLLVALLYALPVNALAVAAAFALLLEFGFTPALSAAGALSLLYATTFLQYVQNSQENNLLCGLALAALGSALRWLRFAQPRWAALSASLLGFSLITRLPALADAALVLAFVALSAPRRFLAFLRLFAPVYLAFAALDRWYHFHRFGRFFGTYTSLYGLQYRRPGDPAAFPFGYPFAHGFFGAWLSPAKSLFLFDPLLAAALLLVWLLRRRLEAPILRYALLTLAVLLVYTGFYATYVTFAGDDAWGDRYAETTAQLLALLAVPLALRFRASLAPALRAALASLVALSVLLQLASTALPMPVELLQLRAGLTTFPIARRFLNIGMAASGRAFSSPDFAPVRPIWRTWNYLPFHVAALAPSLAPPAFALWLVSLAALAWTLTRLLRSIAADLRP